MAKKEKRMLFVESEKLQAIRRQLTPLQLRFAREIIAGRNQTQAYQAAVGGRGTIQTAWKEGHRLRRHPKVNEYLAEADSCALKPSLLTHAQKRSMIRDGLLYGPHDCLDENQEVRPELGHLVQAITREYFADGRLKKVTVKTVPKAQLFVLDNLMGGHAGPEVDENADRAALEALERIGGQIRPSLELPGEKTVAGSIIEAEVPAVVTPMPGL